MLAAHAKFKINQWKIQAIQFVVAAENTLLSVPRLRRVLAGILPTFAAPPVRAHCTERTQTNTQTGTNM
jgi:hypothetical protein